MTKIVLQMPKRTIRLWLWGIRMRVTNRLHRKRAQREFVESVCQAIERRKLSERR